MTTSSVGVWAERANHASRALEAHYWDAGANLYFDQYPNGRRNQPFNYWWMAHGLDVLVDDFERDGDTAHLERARVLLEGIRTHNHDRITNDYFDDMEWLALASLRAFDASGDPAFKSTSLTLWHEVQTGWNEHCGGGIAWRKMQLDYKNTPANGPAAILAARLYRRFEDPKDLEWAKRIFAWLEASLIDPQTGFVWDGMNREGNGNIDKDWAFTYCQGVVIGAALELHAATGEIAYLETARRTVRAAQARLSDPTTHLLPDEGDRDAGLFKGILVRYAALLALETREPDLNAWLERNANTAWLHGRDARTGLFGRSWTKPPEYPLDLTAALSGVMLMNAMAHLERETRPD